MTTSRPSVPGKNEALMRIGKTRYCIGTLVQDACVEPDTCTLLVASERGILQVSLHSGAPRAFYPIHSAHHSRGAQAIALSHDHLTLAVASNTDIYLLNAQNLSLLVHLQNAHAHSIQKLSWHPHKPVLVSSTGQDAIKLWDFQSHEGYTTTALPQTEENREASWSPCGKCIATLHAEGRVEIFAADGNLLVSSKNITAELQNLCWLPDGKRLAAIKIPSQLAIWEASHLKLVSLWEAHKTRVASLGIDHEGHLLSAGADMAARIWNPLSGELLHEYVTETWLNKILPDPIKNRHYLFSEEGSFQAFDARTHQRIPLPSNAIKIAWKADITASGLLVAQGFEWSGAWELHTGAPAWHQNGHRFPQTVVLPTENALFRLQGRTLTRHNAHNLQKEGQQVIPQDVGHFFQAGDTVLHGHLLLKSFDRSYLLNLRTRQLHAWEIRTEVCTHSSQSPTALLIETHRKALLLNTDTQTLLGEWNANKVFTAALSPDGTHAVTGKKDTSLSMRCAVTGEVQWNLDLPAPLTIRALAWAPDSPWVAVGTHTGQIFLLHTDLKTLRSPVQAHQGRINSLSFNLSGDCLVSTSDDASIGLWSIPHMLTLTCQTSRTATSPSRETPFHVY